LRVKPAVVAKLPLIMTLSLGWASFCFAGFFILDFRVNKPYRSDRLGGNLREADRPALKENSPPSVLQHFPFAQAHFQKNSLLFVSAPSG